MGGCGYYTVKPTATVRMLALNTVLYFRSNNLTRDIDDPAGQLAWMTLQLSSARDKKEKVIVTGHIPPGLMVPGLLHWFHPRHKAPFVDILLQFSDIIVAAHFGHDHVDSFKLLQDAEGKRAVAHFSAPSVTPQRYKIPSEVGPPHNPGIRLIKYDRLTGRNINYDQYTMDLTGSNRAGESIWTKLYSFQEAYHVPDMSVTSLRQIFSRLQSDNEAEFPKYCPLTLLNSSEISCTYKARAEVFCGWLKDNLAEVKNCKANLTITNGAENCSTNYIIKNSFVLSITLVLLIFSLFC